MTYFSYTGRRRYVNQQVQCGSDCDQNHRSPLGAACGGSDYQSHACACGSGAQTQNSHQVISALFGEGQSPPVVKFLSPKIGDTVAPGFAVSTQITDDVAVVAAELRVDGQLISSATDSPFAFTGPAELADGTHTLEVTGYDNAGAPGRARIQVVVGPGCESSRDCPTETDACIAGRCVAGPGASGGLGQVCTAATDCASWLCANDDGAQYCVESCKPGQCPEGFGCRDDGMDGGVCWPGYTETAAGCSAGRGPASLPVAPLGALALGLASALRRHRRCGRRGRAGHSTNKSSTSDRARATQPASRSSNAPTGQSTTPSALQTLVRTSAFGLSPDSAHPLCISAVATLSSLGLSATRCEAGSSSRIAMTASSEPG
jgi:hypothetical protein